jgi:hypothetical protein
MILTVEGLYWLEGECILTKQKVTKREPDWRHRLPANQEELHTLLDAVDTLQHLQPIEWIPY